MAVNFEEEKTAGLRIYERAILELKTNLIYVLVLVLGYALYRSELRTNVLQAEESMRIVKDRDEWRNLAVKAINRNFDYVDIITKSDEYKNNFNADDVVDTVRKRENTGSDTDKYK